MCCVEAELAFGVDVSCQQGELFSVFLLASYVPKYTHLHLAAVPMVKTNTFWMQWVGKYLNDDFHANKAFLPWSIIFFFFLNTATEGILILYLEVLINNGAFKVIILNPISFSDSEFFFCNYEQIKTDSCCRNWKYKKVFVDAIRNYNNKTNKQTPGLKRLCVGGWLALCVTPIFWSVVGEDFSLSSGFLKAAFTVLPLKQGLRWLLPCPQVGGKVLLATASTTELVILTWN